MNTIKPGQLEQIAKVLCEASSKVRLDSERAHSLSELLDQMILVCKLLERLGDHPPSTTSKIVEEWNVKTRRCREKLSNILMDICAILSYSKLTERLVNLNRL